MRIALDRLTVRVEGETRPDTHHVTVRAGQWNVGLKGAPPPEPAAPVPGDSALHAAELWFMTASSYQLAVDVDGPAGHGSVVVPVLALATAERPMPTWLGSVLVAWVTFITLRLLGRRYRLPPSVGEAIRDAAPQGPRDGDYYI